MKFVSL
jgi:hypothetical protein